jgi:hypothetical protein
LPLNSTRPRRPSFRYAFVASENPRARPELGGEDAEGEVGVPHELVEHRAPLLAVRGDVRLEVGGQERRLAVGEQRRGREVGVEVLDAAAAELLAELRVGPRGGEERVPAREHLVPETGHRQLGRVDRAAEPRVALEDADPPAAPGEERPADHGVDAAADEHRVDHLHLPRIDRLRS